MLLPKFFVIVLIAVTKVRCGLFDHFRLLQTQDDDTVLESHNTQLLNGALGGIASLISAQCDAINGLYKTKLENTVNMNDIRLYHYVPKRFVSYRILDAPTLLAKSSSFAPLQQTILFVHGYKNTPDEPNVESVAENFYAKGYNFLSFGSNAYTSGSYLTAVGLTPYIGRILADFIMTLIDLGLPYDSIHLVGYSLGAQFSGVAGRIIQRERGIMLPKITAIDPATVCFASHDSQRLSQHDAAYVDAIHTTILSFSEENVGHADFYVNGDVPLQPGCYSIGCSHTRSILIYAESIIHKGGFLARKCENWKMFSSGSCNNGSISVLGFGSPMNSRGKFFLKTNSEYPFALGLKGL